MKAVLRGTHNFYGIFYDCHFTDGYLITLLKRIRKNTYDKKTVLTLI